LPRSVSKSALLRFWDNRHVRRNEAATLVENGAAAFKPGDYPAAHAAYAQAKLLYGKLEFCRSSGAESRICRAAAPEIVVPLSIFTKSLSVARRIM
jgi:hypothetical protein